VGRIEPTVLHIPALPVAREHGHDLLSKLLHRRSTGPIVSLRLAIPLLTATKPAYTQRRTNFRLEKCTSKAKGISGSLGDECVEIARFTSIGFGDDRQVVSR
jgi:hypothetical protein